MADWLADQIFYEIFPDRFAIGGGSTARARRKLLPRGAELRAWDQLPARPPRGKDFFGGDLRGIAERLDHVASVGATALYLTPVFASPSNHRYDATDHHRVDPALGGDEALVDLLSSCRARGMRVVLDGVLNHVSDQHPRAKGRRGLLTHGGVAQRWRGFGHMPELDLDDPEVRAELLDGPDALIPRWLRRGAAGWRLDVAADLTARIVRDVVKVSREVDPETCVIPEIMAFPEGWMGRDGDADGVMNYYARRALLDWIEDPRATPARVVTAAVSDVIASCGLDATLRSWMMLSSHDTPRAIDACGSAERARLAATLQFTMPGAPVVYYGEEVGMRGEDDPANRAPMPWDAARWDARTLAHYRALAALRTRSRALRRGRFLDLSTRAGDGVLAFVRLTDDPEETVLVVAHLDPVARPVNVYLPLGQLHDAVKLVDLVAHESDGPWTSPCWITSGRLAMTLPPGGVRVLGVESEYIDGYRLYRKRELPR